MITPETGNIILADHIYPIGSIYEGSENSDPSELFGGNWECLYNDYDYIYVCSQVVYPEFIHTTPANSSEKVLLSGSYDYVFNGLYNKDLPCPPNYTTKLRWSMEITTQGNTQIGLSINDVLVLTRRGTWSNTDYRYTNVGGLYELGVDIPSDSDAIYNQNGYCHYADIVNNNSYDAMVRVWDITKHVYHVSNKKISKWKRIG